MNTMRMTKRNDIGIAYFKGPQTIKHDVEDHMVEMPKCAGESDSKFNEIMSEMFKDGRYPVKVRDIFNGQLEDPGMVHSIVAEKLKQDKCVMREFIHAALNRQNKLMDTLIKDEKISEAYATEQLESLNFFHAVLRDVYEDADAQDRISLKKILDTDEELFTAINLAEKDKSSKTAKILAGGVALFIASYVLAFISIEPNAMVKMATLQYGG